MCLPSNLFILAIVQRMSRIKIGKRVYEAWRCDVPKANDEARWSYGVFGENWHDACIFGVPNREEINGWWYSM